MIDYNFKQIIKENIIKCQKFLIYAKEIFIEV